MHSAFATFDDSDDEWQDMPIIHEADTAAPRRGPRMRHYDVSDSEGSDDEVPPAYQPAGTRNVSGGTVPHIAIGNATGRGIATSSGDAWREKVEEDEADYTRLELDDDPEDEAISSRTQYLFQDDKEMTPLAQMQATKELLTEAQRIAYVGLCRLVTKSMVTFLAENADMKKGRKELDQARQSAALWAAKIMARLYRHMDVNDAEQKMIELLTQHGVTTQDLVPSLLTTHTMDNPEYDPVFAAQVEREKREEMEKERLKGEAQGEGKKQEQEEGEGEESETNGESQTSLSKETDYPVEQAIEEELEAAEATPEPGEALDTTDQPSDPEATPDKSESPSDSTAQNVTPSTSTSAAVGSAVGSTSSPNGKTTSESEPNERTPETPPPPVSVDPEHIGEISIEKKEEAPPEEDDFVETLPGVSLTTSAADRTVTLDIRWTVLCDLFLALIADSVYDARSRVLLHRAADSLGLKWIDVVRFERRLTEALEIQEGVHDKEHGEVLEEQRKKKLKQRYAMMGAAALGGGLVIGLSAGLLAPFIGAGLGAAFTTIGVSGTTTFLTGTAGAALISSGATLTGSFIGGKAMAARTRHVKTFDFIPIHNNKRVNVVITVSGFMNSVQDDVRLPYSVLDPVVGDTWSLLWEPDMMGDTGNVLRILTSEVLTQVGQQILAMTIMTSLLSALQWPIMLSKLGYLIDNPWSNALDRAREAGTILAQVLIQRRLGVRPATLIGFSLGARLIFYCLLELSRLKAYGVVEEVYLFGATVTGSAKEWHAARSVVAGRFVNAYAMNDWVLGYLFRATSGGLQTVAGLRPITLAQGIENINVTGIVVGHLSYRSLMPALLEHVGFRVTADHFDEPDEELARLEALEKEETENKGIRGFFRRGKKGTAGETGAAGSAKAGTNVVFDYDGETSAERGEAEKSGAQQKEEGAASVATDGDSSPAPQIAPQTTPQTTPEPARSSESESDSDSDVTPTPSYISHTHSPIQSIEHEERATTPHDEEPNIPSETPPLASSLATQEGEDLDEAAEMAEEEIPVGFDLSQLRREISQMDRETDELHGFTGLANVDLTGDESLWPVASQNALNWNERGAQQERNPISGISEWDKSGPDEHSARELEESNPW